MQVVVAEKYLVARAIAQAVFGPAAAQAKDGFVGSAGGMKILITWADGHVLGLAEPEAYDPAWADRDRTDVLPLVPAGYQFLISPRVDEVLRVLERCLAAATSVVNACDAAREGELIFDEIANWCGVYERRVPIKRLWITDTTADGIRRSWETQLEHEDRKLRVLREQARTRAQCDWIWGISGSRYVSAALRNTPGLRSRFVAVGRCRSPVQGMIADRCREVYLHRSQPFYRGYVAFKNEKGETCEALLLAPPELKFGARDCDWTDDGELEKRLAHIRSSAVEPWTVVEGNNRPASEYAPPPFDLTDLQRTANRLWGWSAKYTLRIAQALYAKHRAITYPRTDCWHLKKEMQGEVLALWHRYWHSWRLKNVRPAVLARIPEWQPVENQNFADKISDHHAIIPTGETPPAFDAKGHPAPEYHLWDLIVRRFITSFLPPAKVYASSRAFTLPYVGGEILRALVKAAPVQEPNWLLFEDLTGTTRGMGRKLADRLEDKMLPEMGPTALLSHAAGKRLETEPPALFTYDSILYAMRKAGIGTVATQADLIEDLISTGYVMEDSRNRLVITEEGDRVVALLRQKGGEKFLDTKLTAFWEGQLEKIGRPGEQGRRRESLLQDVVAQVRELGEAVLSAHVGPELVFCPKTGLHVQEAIDGWVFAGWPDILCRREILGRAMKASEYRDIFAAGKKGAGPYEGFVSRRTQQPFRAWLSYDKVTKRFQFRYKLRKG